MPRGSSCRIRNVERALGSFESFETIISIQSGVFLKKPREQINIADANARAPSLQWTIRFFLRMCVGTGVSDQSFSYWDHKSHIQI